MTQLIHKKMSMQVTEMVHELCDYKTPQNYGADTNLSFIITYDPQKLLSSSKTVKKNYLR